MAKFTIQIAADSTEGMGEKIKRLAVIYGILNEEGPPKLADTGDPVDEESGTSSRPVKSLLLLVSESVCNDALGA